MTQYPITAASYDADTLGDSSTTVKTERDRVVDPATSCTAIFLLDTSAIPDTDEVSAASFNFYDHSYSATKGVSREEFLFIFNWSSYAYDSLASRTYSGAGWVSVAFPSNRLGSNYINKAGFTLIQGVVNDPAAGQYRTWLIRAYEYAPSPDYRAYLDITHGPASTGPRNLGSTGVGK